MFHRKRREEAEDLTQSFFLGLFEKRTLEGFAADPAAGRFRSLLRSLLDGFVSTATRHSRRKKRGGDRKRVPLQPEQIAGIEYRIACDTDGDPFEEEWRATVLDRALVDFRGEARDRIWKRRLGIFLAYDVEPEGRERPTYADLARQFGVKAYDVKNDLVSARRRFAEIVLDRVRDACRDETAARDEFKRLFGERRE